MDQLHLIASAWSWNPVVIGGCLFLLALYAIAVRFRFTKRAILFLLGVGLLFVALASPLNLLASTYLFSAHAIQDLILLQIVPAFLILGIPASAAAAVRQRAPIFARVIRNPAAAWIAANAAMIAWHVPALPDTPVCRTRVDVALPEGRGGTSGDRSSPVFSEARASLKHNRLPADTLPGPPMGIPAKVNAHSEGKPNGIPG